MSRYLNDLRTPCKLPSPYLSCQVPALPYRASLQTLQSEIIGIFHRTTLVAASVAVTVSFFTGIGRAQAVGGTDHAATDSTICDVGSAAQKSKVPQSSKTDSNSSSSDSTKEHLRLSIPNASTKTALPEGAFCKRPETESQKPSSSTSSPAQGDGVQPPVSRNEDGLIIIHANGQDFASVLQAVGTLTGVAIEMPLGGAEDQVFMNLGPVSAKEALIALMDGTKYNYAMVSSPRDPGTVTRLILSERSVPASATSLVASAGGALPQATLYGQGSQENEDAATTSAENHPSPPPNIPAVIPSSVPTGINIDQIAAQSNKTRGQVLDDLQKQQLQALDVQSASQSPQ
jgi:hypothetical protein